MFITFEIHLSTLEGSNSTILDVYDKMYLGNYDFPTQ